MINTPLTTPNQQLPNNSVLPTNEPTTFPPIEPIIPSTDTPPAQQASALAPKLTLNDLFKLKLPWWQTILSFLPFTMVINGGALGAAIGLLLMLHFMNVWTKNWSNLAKIVYVIGLTIGGWVLTFVLIRWLIVLFWILFYR